MELPVFLRVPAKCSGGELDAFESLVKVGGEVNLDGIRNRIENAYFLAWVSEGGGELVGIAALKKPNENYRSSIFHKAQSKEEPSNFEVELGWIFVRKEFRKNGLATKLVEKLFSVNNSKGVYATTRENNDPVLPLLRNFGFVQSGFQYPSTEGNYDLVLHIKPV